MNKKITRRLLAAIAVAMFFIGGVFAQIDITIYQSDGTVADGAILYTINSSTGAVTTVATDGGAGDGDATTNSVIQVTPTANTNYVISNAGATQWNTYAPPAVPANITIYLNASFAETVQDYVAGNTADKITINQDMPFWVYPSPVHNPAWTAPAGTFEAEATIVDAANLLSTFAWTIDGGTDVSGTANDNYVEVSWATTGVKTLTAVETAAAAYGSCSGNTKTFFTEVINIPYLEWANAENDPVGYTVGGAAAHVILTECDGTGGTVNPTITNEDNTSEEYSWYIGMDYQVFAATIAGTDITLGAAGTLPAGRDITGDITPAATISSANPLILDGTVAAEQFDAGDDYAFFGAAQTWPAIDNNITVYRFDLSTTNGRGYNALISRKSDYVAFRAAAGTPANWDDPNYTWYDDDNGGANQLTAYIVILPTPKTGPIYHINNDWAL